MAGNGGAPREAAVLTPYLPRIAIEWVGRADERRRTLDASLAFVDVTGFTALSERLAAQGRAGAEEVTELLGECFTELLADAYLQGGSLLKFGGDALLLLFDGEDHAVRAASAAAAMRRTIRRVGNLKTSVGNVKLRTSAGVHSGEVHLFQVGGSHRELIVTGPTASQVLEMEAAAKAGQVVVSRATAAALQPGVLGDAHEPGFTLRDRVVRRPDAAFPEPPAPITDLAPAVPAALRPHLLAGNVEPEHRHVAIAFVGYRLDPELLQSDDAADALDELVTSVQDAVDHYGVTFLGTDIDRDGGKILLVAGAPEARDDDSGRMLGALRRIADTPRVLPVRIGVNRGCVFVGDIGPQYRRTYTVMGDAVNLAARLMAAAEEGEILATEELMATSRRTYETTPRPPFAVKGKKEVVRAFSVGSASRRTSRTATTQAALAPLVGRDAEIDQLLWAAAEAQTGNGSTVEITGAAGIGKSRLVNEFRRRSPEIESVTVSAEPYEQTTPWSAFGRFLRNAFGLSALDPAGAVERLTDLGASTPEAVPWLPLVGEVVGVPMPPTAEAADLEPIFAIRRTYDAITALLSSRFAGPALFLFEDLQWADEASLDSLRELSRAASAGRQWLLLLTRRNVDGTDLLREKTTQLHLAPLDDAASRQFIAAATANAPLRPHRRDALARSAAGNPLFLEELLRAGAASTEEALPDSVQAAVASTLDRLPSEDRRLLRYAAVLGVEFDHETFSRIAGEPVPPPDVLALRWSGLTEEAGPGRFRFSSQIVRDVAYESLPFRKRRDLHGTAGDVIEGWSDAEEPPAELLSLHFFRAQRHEKCWKYSVAAAARARRVHANAECVSLLDRALSVAPRVPGLDQDTMGDVWMEHANALHNLGEYERAEASYREARRLATRPETIGSALSCEARIAEFRGRPTTAVRRLRRAIRETADADRAVRADLEVLLGWVMHRMGRQREAKQWADKAMTTARASANTRALAEANLLFDWASLHLGATGPWERAADALALFEELGDLNRVGFTLNAMGAFAYYGGRWNEAAALYRRSLAAYERAGNDGDAARARYNAAEILLDQRRFAEAGPLLEEVERVYRSVGYRAGVALTGRDLGRIAAQRGELEAAGERLREARDAFTELQAAGRVLEVDVWIADVLRRQGRLAEALELVESAADRGRRTGASLLAPVLERVRGEIHAASGHFDEAEQALAAALDAARAAAAGHEVAITLEAMAAVARAAGRRMDPGADAERSELFEKLGIEAAPT